jgi:hypothetical protein
MRIAKPLLLVATPIGVIGGVIEAFRLTGGLAFLMIAMLALISVAIGMVLLTIRRERAFESAATRPAATRNPEP